MMQRLHWLSFIFLIAFLLPFMIWYQQTGDLAVYFSAAAPSGQLPYIISKLSGMVALSCIAWQMIMTILGKLYPVSIRWLGSIHRVFGVGILVFALAHMLLFISAVSLRQASPAWGLFFPGFADFYHTYLTVGLLALLLLFAVAVAGLFRVLKQNQWAKQVHRLYWLSISLVYLHALAIGSESQSSAGLILYFTLGLLVLLLWSWYGIKQTLVKVAVS